jgi:hypothetical protein
MNGNRTAVSICSNALIMLGAEPIANFEGEGACSVASANLFNPTYISLLQSYDWNFTRKQAQLNRLAEKPLMGYSYKFALPTDCLRIISVTATDYELIENTVYANQAEIYCDYVASIDVTKAPIYFTSALEYLLASKLAIPVTGDLNKADIYKRMTDEALKKARHLDSRQTPTRAIVSKPFIDARYN